MSHDPRRQLRDLSFGEALSELETAYEQAPSHDLVIYRETSEKDQFGVPICDAYTQTDIAEARWSSDDVLATNWIFEDRGVENVPLMPENVGNERRSHTRDEILTVVNFVIGRFYYSNPDAHKLGPEICKRLGYAE
jgi:hypothetical protein